MGENTEGDNFKLISMDAATKRGVERTEERQICKCLDPQYMNKPKWHKLEIHAEVQDTNCSAWKQLQEYIDQAADDGREVFEPGSEIGWEDWLQIITLPKSISKLTQVKELRFYGSNLVCIPPEIGQMSNLEVFDIYTSYRLHWLPYEILNCKKLKESRISTRALYGNYKYRPPFPRLPSDVMGIRSMNCSVCQKPFDRSEPQQVWISLNIASDVVPLLVNACSKECINDLPTPPERYIQKAHRGGRDVTQPPKEF